MKNRPVWVWLISIFYILTNSSSLLSYALIHFEVFTLSEPQMAYFENLTAIDYVLSIGNSVLVITAAAFLLSMKKASVNLFGAAFILNFITTALQVNKINFNESLKVPGLLAMFVGVALVFGVYLYCRRLNMRGLLH